MNEQINEKVKEVLGRATDYSGSTSRKVSKGILGGVIVLLLGGLGLEVSNNDWNLNSILGGSSVSDSKVVRDSSGNVLRDKTTGNVVTAGDILRDKAGNVVTEGGKKTNEYNCADFATQAEAQAFFDKAGGVAGDVNRLDGNKDGQACESLPKEK